MSFLLVLSAVVLLSMPWSSSASCLCSVSGDPHITTCDTKTHFTWQGTGAYSLFKTPDTELQCDFDYPRYDNGSIIHQMFTYVSSCRLSYKTANGCEFTMLTGGNNDQQTIYVGNTKMTLSDVKPFLQKYLPSMGVNVDVDVENAKTTCTMQTQQGPIAFEVAPYQVHVTSASASQCKGMCGQCDGKAPLTLNLTDAASIRNYSTSFAADGSNVNQPIQLKPLPIQCLRNTSSPTNGTATLGQSQNPTSSPMNSSNAPTTSTGSATPMPSSSPSMLPTTGPMQGAMPKPTIAIGTAVTSQPLPMNSSSSSMAPGSVADANSSLPLASYPTPPSLRVEMPNPRMINDNPVFESVDVLQKVVNQCLCGQPKTRYYSDAIFGRYFEDCVYDKSFPGAEKLALSNMMTLYRAISKGFTSNNASMMPMDMNVCKSMILQPAASKRPDQIPLGQGVSYIPIYTKQNSTGLPDLRSTVMTGTGETVDECEINQTTGSLIIPSPAPTSMWNRGQSSPSMAGSQGASNGMSGNAMLSNGIGGMAAMTGSGTMAGMTGSGMMAGKDMSGNGLSSTGTFIAQGGLIGNGWILNRTNNSVLADSTLNASNSQAGAMNMTSQW